MLYLEATHDRLLSAYCKKEVSHLRPDTLFRSVPAPHLLLQREPEKAATIMMAFISSLSPSPSLPIYLHEGMRQSKAMVDNESGGWRFCEAQAMGVSWGRRWMGV